MATQKEIKALRNSTSKEKRKDSKGTFSLKKIAHHPMKKVIAKKKPMRKYFLWPSTINKKYQTMKKKGLTIEEFYEEAIKLIKDLNVEKIHSNTLKEKVQGLKIEVEEHICIEESIQKKLEESNQERKELEAKVVSMRKAVKKDRKSVV